MTCLVATATPAALEPGQIVSYAPYYLVGERARAEVLGEVETPPFADVPLYRLRLIDALPGYVMPHFGPDGGETVFPAYAAGDEVPNALGRDLIAL